MRELLNAVEHAATLGGETIGLQDLPARIRAWRPPTGPAGPAPGPLLALEPPAPGAEPILPLAELERRHVLRTLAELGGDRRRAAEALGIDLSTLYRKLKRWEEDAPSPPGAPHRATDT